ncbi:1,2-phenylacetyl-CoA epoxidase subunit PaaE [Chelativorans sp. ZYF759]|uniref:1,2-phenylacetyl-CoA epoxidase subunit PaaE n=1 Tax=Chelativorans sp. ZYF759 TaxID=2692213 RepID=UPI001AEEEC71|nr:1,2-phenylacetyl-CoA epoxidase subunit PaaE [Chelativorans sp. ZYF759]
MARFHELKVAEIVRETPEAVAIAFEVPDDLRNVFSFRPGQYLTLAADIDGEEARRSYSICSAPGERHLKVGVKQIADGRFSGFVNERLNVGDTIRVMPPEGRFTSLTGERHDYILIAAGSGITPMLSIAKTVLAHEPMSTITLVYGNRTSGSIMFLEELEDLKDRYLQRFSMLHMLSRETQDVDILNGRIDGGRIVQLAERQLIEPLAADGIFICGPGEMIDSVTQSLRDYGVDPDRIRFERFTPSGDAPPPRPRSREAEETARQGATIEVVLDGVRRSFTLEEADSGLIEAAQKAGLELPYSCAGGMCCTCRCRIVEGEAEMAVNYSLQPWEIEAGFTLACQSRPTTRRLVLDFDAA